MKKILFLGIGLSFGITSTAQIKYSTRAKTSDGEPVFSTQFDTRLKINGYFNLGGNDPSSQSINLPSANPYNPIQGGGFDMNMYSSQLANRTIYNGLKGGPLTVYVEGQFWGAPDRSNNFQLRQAFLEYHHFKLGRGWTFFGSDGPSWYNTLDWEGPSMGVWARHVQLKYSTYFGENKSWRIEAGFENSAYNLAVNNRSGMVDSIKQPSQVTPDPIIALSKQAGKTFLRFSTMYRMIKYSDVRNGGNAFTSGWGVHLNMKTMLNKKDYFMAQFLAGSGIGASYTVSGALFSNHPPGQGSNRFYDALYDQENNFKTVPIYGVSGGAEFFYGKDKRMHSNLVLSYTTEQYQATPQSLVTSKLVSDNANHDFVTLNKKSSTTIAYPFATINLLYEVLNDVKIEGVPINFTIGLEYNVGAKTVINDVSRSSIVNRIAFGLMLGF